MATITLRPTSASGSSWSNIAYIYDGSTSNGATVTATSSNYSSRVATCNFDTSVIPNGATIQSATLSVMYKQSSSTSSRRYTPYIDINGSSSNRVISSQLSSTSTVTNTANVLSYMSNLSTITITPYRQGTSGTNNLTVYEMWIDVEYTVKVDGQESITVKPSSATASSWSNIANAYDGSTTSTATVSISRSDYSSKTATFNFNTLNVPSGATILGATLHINAKASSNSRITLYADINGSSSSRVVNTALTTTQTDITADITSYINSLSSIKLTGYMTSSTSTTFSLYEVYVVVDYVLPTTTKTQLVNIGSSVITTVYIGNTLINRIYLGDTLIFES